jgi:hypothetical protein
MRLLSLCLSLSLCKTDLIIKNLRCYASALSAFPKMLRLRVLPRRRWGAEIIKVKVKVKVEIERCAYLALAFFVIEIEIRVYDISIYFLFGSQVPAFGV